MPADATALGEFSVSEDYPAAATTALTAPDIKIGDTGTECDEDFVIIPQGTLASSTVSAAKDRYR